LPTPGALWRSALDLPLPPDAIFSATDQLSQGVFAELKARNVPIPGQVGLAAFATDLVHNTLEPAVTTIAPVGIDIGNAAARLCIAHMEGKATKTKTEILDADLMIRRSSVRTHCEPPAPGTPQLKQKDLYSNLVDIY
jgi:LacI family transcriptional regulator